MLAQGTSRVVNYRSHSLQPLPRLQVRRFSSGKALHQSIKHRLEVISIDEPLWAVNQTVKNDDDTASRVHVSSPAAGSNRESVPAAATAASCSGSTSSHVVPAPPPFPAAAAPHARSRHDHHPANGLPPPPPPPLLHSSPSFRSPGGGAPCPPQPPVDSTQGWRQKLQRQRSQRHGDAAAPSETARVTTASILTAAEEDIGWSASSNAASRRGFLSQSQVDVDDDGMADGGCGVYGGPHCRESCDFAALSIKEHLSSSSNGGGGGRGGLDRHRAPAASVSMTKLQR